MAGPTPLGIPPLLDIQEAIPERDLSSGPLGSHPKRLLDGLPFAAREGQVPSALNFLPGSSPGTRRKEGRSGRLSTSPIAGFFIFLDLLKYIWWGARVV